MMITKSNNQNKIQYNYSKKTLSNYKDNQVVFKKNNNNNNK